MCWLMGPDFGEPPSRAARAALKKTGKPSETTTGPAQHFLFLEKPAKRRDCADLERQQGGVLPAERGAPSRAGRSQQSGLLPAEQGVPREGWAATLQVLHKARKRDVTGGR